MKKKLVAIFVALTMCLTMVIPAGAAATPTTSIWNAGDLYYWLNYYASNDAMVCSIDGNTVTLKKDITLSKNLSVYPSKEIVLDMGEYSITTSAGISVGSSSTYGTFIIKGSSTATTDKIVFTGNSGLTCSGDNVTVENIAISGTNVYSNLIKCNGSQTMTFTNCDIDTSYKIAMSITSSNKVNINNCDIFAQGTADYPAIEVTNNITYIPTVNIKNSKIHTNYYAAVSLKGGETTIEGGRIYLGTGTGTDKGVLKTTGTDAVKFTLNNVAINASLAERGVYLDNSKAECTIKGDDTKILGTKYAISAIKAKSLTINGGTFGSTEDEFGAYISNDIATKNLMKGHYIGKYAGIACIVDSTYANILNEKYMTNDSELEKSYTYGYNISGKDVYTFAKPDKITIADAVYDGKVKNPKVTVTDCEGTKLTEGKDYTIVNSAGRKNVGKYKVTVKFADKYSGCNAIIGYFSINPKATKISSLKASSKSFTVNWSKVSTQCTGYEIQYSTSSKFNDAKTVKVTSYKTTGKTIKSLKAKKTYYVRVRTYKSGLTSEWSAAKKVTVK